MLVTFRLVRNRWNCRSRCFNLGIKLNSPFPFTVVNEQSGNGTLSYIPNRKAFSEGGYEVNSARFSPGGGELLVDAVIKALIDLFPYK